MTSTVVEQGIRFAESESRHNHGLETTEFLAFTILANAPAYSCQDRRCLRMMVQEAEYVAQSIKLRELVNY